MSEFNLGNWLDSIFSTRNYLVRVGRICILAVGGILMQSWYLHSTISNDANWMDAVLGEAGDDELSHHLLRPRYPEMSVMRVSGVRAPLAATSCYSRWPQTEIRPSYVMCSVQGPITGRVIPWLAHWRPRSFSTECFAILKWTDRCRGPGVDPVHFCRRIHYCSRTQVWCPM